MRINIYTEELTDEVAIVSKEGIGDDGKPRTFYGLRFFLKSPDELHHNEEDDDRSAITFWGLSVVKPLMEKAIATLKREFINAGASGHPGVPAAQEPHG